MIPLQVHYTITIVSNSIGYVVNGVWTAKRNVSKFTKIRYLNKTTTLDQVWLVLHSIAMYWCALKIVYYSEKLRISNQTSRNITDLRDENWFSQH